MDNLWEEDLYELLGVDESATPEEVKKAYKKLAIELHPDRFPDDAAKREEATARFGKITNAYNVLKDEEERAEYDFARRLGFAGSNGPPNGGGAKAAGGGAAAGAQAAAKGPTAPAEDDSGVSEARKSQAQNQFDLGKIAHKAKSWAKAIQHYKEAARLDPHVADYPAYLGLAYTQQGLKTPALKAFEQAYKLDKKHSVLKEHYTPPGEKAKGKDAKSGGGGLFASIMALFGGGKKDDAKGKKGAKGKDAKGKKGAGKKAASKR